MTTWQTSEPLSLAAGAERVTRLAENSFGASERPAVIASAPGRVNLIGEHTDYNGGLALPIALPHRTFAHVRLREDRTVRLTSAQADGVVEVSLDDVAPGADLGWASYVVGVAWAAEQAGLLQRCPGFDITIDSCVPFGAGLSSSAALECAVAVALATATGSPLTLGDDETRARWVEACVRAENEIAGAPTGGMDQAASLRAHEGHALALDCRTGEISHVPLDLEAAVATLLVVDTRAPHALVDGQYAARRTDCERAAQLLDIPLLADITDLDSALAQLAERAPAADRDRLVARTRHVVTEIGRTRGFIALLQDGALATSEGRLALGELMFASHASLRDDYEVTCPELDLVVETARSAGAIGARMTGGGFGGSAIVLTTSERAADTAAAIRAAFAEGGFAEPHLYAAIAAAPGFAHDTIEP